MGHARIRMTDRLRRLPMGPFTRHRTGELAGILTTDIALVEDIWSHLFGVFAASLILPLLVGVGLCILDWRLGIAVLLTMPVALLSLRLTSPIFARHIGSVLDATGDANARLVEYVQGIAVLRTFGRHGEGYERLRASMVRLRDALTRAEIAPTPLLSIYGFRAGPRLRRRPPTRLRHPDRRGRQRALRRAALAARPAPDGRLSSGLVTPERRESARLSRCGAPAGFFSYPY
jgi:ABC-type multidrug transport system fused ATPase/permease subunit